MSKTTVTKGKSKAPSTDATVPDELTRQLLQDSGAGFEEAGREAYAIPFLRVLQDLSPQVKRTMAGYVPGAKPGMIYNTVSRAAVESVRVIPCHFQQQFIEWLPRGKGAGKTGFVAAHPANSPLISRAVRDGGANILPNGHLLSDTRNHFVLVIADDGTVTQALLSMSSTQIKVSRRWMSQMRAAVISVGARIINAPAFAWSYRLTSEEESNDQGSWYSWVVSDRERVTDLALYGQAKAFHEMLRAGGDAGKVNYSEMDPDQGHAGGAPSPEDLEDDEIPDA